MYIQRQPTADNAAADDGQTLQSTSIEMGKKALKTQEMDTKTGIEEEYSSTAICSSEDESGALSALASDDERQESEPTISPFVPGISQPKSTFAGPGHLTTLGFATTQPNNPAHLPAIHTAPMTAWESAGNGAVFSPLVATASSLCINTQATLPIPKTWVKPKISIEGPEIFHGLLRLNEENDSGVASTETFVAFKDKWRVVTTPTQSPLGPNVDPNVLINPWDPKVCAYPMPVTYSFNSQTVEIRDEKPIRSIPKPPPKWHKFMSFFCSSYYDMDD